MRATVTTELYGPDGRLLRRDSQPSRSLTFGFIRPLLSMFRDTAWSVDPVGIRYCYHMAAPPAEAQVSMEAGNYPYGSQFFGTGQAWGIQLSADTAAVVPGSTYLPQRIGKRRGVEAHCRTGRMGFVADRCRGLASDRQQHLWVVRSEYIARLGLVPGKYMPFEVEFAAPNGRHVYGMTYDGTWLWTGNRLDNLIHCIDPTDGAVQFEWATPGSDQVGLAWDFDQDKIWSYDRETGLLYLHTPATGAVEDSFDTGVTGPYLDIEWKDGYIYLPHGNTMRVFDPATGNQVATWWLPEPVYYPVFIGPYWIISPAAVYGTDYGQFYSFLDYTDIEVPELEIGGCEVHPIDIAHPDGSFVVRRNFLNNSPADITVNKVGIYSGPAQECLAADVLAAPVVIGAGQELAVSYTFQITV